MKKTIFIVLSFIATITMFYGCDDEAENVGIQIQPDTDNLYVGTDTFHLNSESVQIDHIISRPDSLLLGTYVDDFIGSTRGDIISEFILPTTGFKYLPDDKAVTIADSVVLTMYFRSYFGSSNSPLNISVYELKDSLNRNVEYNTDIDVEKFADFSKKVGSVVTSVKDPETEKISSRIDIKLSSDFLNRFFTKNPDIFKSQENFKRFFKGLYITTDFGSSTMLSINSMKIRLSYHYYYKDEPESVIESYHDFWANQEIKRVNRLTHPHRLSSATSDANFNLLASPSNYYTKVSIPIERIRKRIKKEGKVLDVNGASLRLNVQNKSNYEGTKLPYVSSLMLIKESAVDGFFAERSVPSDTSALIANIDSTYITARSFKYHYTFNQLSKLLVNEINNDSTGSPYLNMIILPVTPKYRQTSNYQQILTGVNQNMKLEATKIYSGTNSDIPMTIEVIYSQF